MKQFDFESIMKMYYLTEKALQNIHKISISD